MPPIQESKHCGLPLGRPINWNARRKAAVVLAFASGRLTIGDVYQRYGISADEFLEWQRRAAQGPLAFQVTKRQARFSNPANRSGFNS
jgi:hypothetical protein